MCGFSLRALKVQKRKNTWCCVWRKKYCSLLNTEHCQNFSWRQDVSCRRSLTRHNLVMQHISRRCWVDIVRNEGHFQMVQMGSVVPGLWIFCVELTAHFVKRKRGAVVLGLIPINHNQRILRTLAGILNVIEVQAKFYRVLQRSLHEETKLCCVGKKITTFACCQCSFPFYKLPVFGRSGSLQTNWEVTRKLLDWNFYTIIE